MFEIVEKVRLSHTVALFRIKAPQIASKRRAGQFIMLRLNGFGERIPLTIVDSDTEEGTITIISQEMGKTTSMLGALEKGDGHPRCCRASGETDPYRKFRHCRMHWRRDRYRSGISDSFGIEGSRQQGHFHNRGQNKGASHTRK